MQTTNCTIFLMSYLISMRVCVCLFECLSTCVSACQATGLTKLWTGGHVAGSQCDLCLFLARHNSLLSLVDISTLWCVLGSRFFPEIDSCLRIHSYKTDERQRPFKRLLKSKKSDGGYAGKKWILKLWNPASLIQHVKCFWECRDFPYAPSC